ncbi:hypothetical protein [Roseiconus lacunae]|uniref:Uncharacterized protein n=1 Tax=Roseiconus lacunae TaxID=2605694 RepID=A0ABT7PFL7_9BACT|nr:hypothetical protein [Roseiconus lacunae]MDM4015290.1 hypothetical protein [Roseiconus lacunae]
MASLDPQTRQNLLNDGRRLALMCAWFDNEFPEEFSPQQKREHLESVYGDGGETASLFEDLDLAFEQPISEDQLDELFMRSAAWFEAIDPANNGYDTLEEALTGIFDDEGHTAKLYREIKARASV